MGFKRKKFFSGLTAAVFALSTLMALFPAAVGKKSEVYAAANGITRTSVHDPSIVKANGRYYIFGSHMAFAKSSNLSQWTNFSTNIQSNYNNIFSVGKKWSATGVSSYDLSGNLWAPDVIWNPTMRKWCMYMSVNGADWNSSIALCTADNIEGPYTYKGTVVYSGFNNSNHPVSMTDYYKVCGNGASISRYLSGGKWNSRYGTNAIDPTVFYDQSGKLWMIYGSWFGGLFMLELDENTGLRDYNVKYSLDTNAADGKASDPYMGIRVAGGNGASGEAPYIEYIDGYYHLFTTYGGLDSNGGYNMRVFRSKNVTGPYVDHKGQYATYTAAVGSGNTSGNVGQRLMSYYRWSCNNVAQVAQGHNSVLTDSNGKKFLVYHTRFDDGYEFHEVRVHQLFTNADGWLVAAPFEYLGETISSTGYSKSSVVGTYEFLVQDIAASNLNKIQKTVTIKLNSDMTISGAVSGTWSMSGSKPHVSLNIGGIKYKGVFLKQYDESTSHKEVMTFTAVGTNNICIMGCKGNSNTGGTVPSLPGGSTSSGSVKFTETSVSNGIYYIKNVNSGKYLDVANGSGENGANIQQWSYNGSDAQKFKIQSDGNGYYYILTGASGYKSCVDIDSGNAANGTNVMQWEYWGGDMQKYKIAKNADGSYSFITRASGLKSALDVYEISKNDGANINQWEYWGGAGQSFTLERYVEADPYEGIYYFQNVNSGKYLDIANGSGDNGANIQQWGYNGSHAQKFKIVADGSGYYYILTGSSDYKKCIDIENGSANNGTNVIQWEYWGGDMQKYKIVKHSDGTFSFLSKASGTKAALEVYEHSKADGGNVVQWEYWGGNTQKWKLTKTS